MEYEVTVTEEVEIEDDSIIEYVKKHYSVNDVFDDDEIKECCSDCFDVEDVYDDSVLKKWAEDNSYIKEETE